MPPLPTHSRESKTLDRQSTSRWLVGSTQRRPGGRRAPMATESASLGSFLFERPGAEHPHPRGQCCRHIEDVFASIHQLLGRSRRRAHRELPGLDF